ncbi:MAG: glycerophosphodiester phosphodiesterase family protein, partial [Planctomycetota bacterium]|nr:glycerophosphodiester phosphodiesterase family protein [Planctomycetota bacterium]
MQLFPTALGAAIFFTSVIHAAEPTNIQLGPRPFYLIDKMPDGQLKTKLQSCAIGPFSRTNFSIAHRGAPLQFPEHTRESYQAAARMGAGIIECDVTFTADLTLICRHSQGDLATSTNILATPLAATCIKPFTPATFNADGSVDEPASATCRTSELTLAEFLSLKGKMDAGNRVATTPGDFMNGTVPW